MNNMQPGMKEDTLDIESLSCPEACEKLSRVVDVLSEGPPRDKAQFTQCYNGQIRPIVERIETCKQSRAENVLNIFDSNFRDVIAVYSPDLGSKSGRSIFPHDYSFFIGGLKIYVSSLKQEMSEV